MTTHLKPAEDGHNFFVRLVEGYRSAKIVFTANALGIFDALSREPRRAEDVAAALKLDARATQVLLCALGAVGLVDNAEGRFSNGPLAAEFLVSERPRFVGNNLAFQELIWPAWSALSDVVRSGKPHTELLSLLQSQDSGFTRQYIRGMDNISKRPAEVVAHALGARKITRMLDVGGGPGTFSRAVLSTQPEAQATILDLPDTLQVARELTPPEVARRLELRAANYLTDDFGKNYDLVLLSHVTHDESPETTQHLLKKAFASLQPGGRVAIHDFVVSDDGCSPAFGALFAVNMLVYTKGGRTYSIQEYSRLLASAGFASVETMPILEGKVGNSTVLVVAEKPLD